MEKRKSLKSVTAPQKGRRLLSCHRERSSRFPVQIQMCGWSYPLPADVFPPPPILCSPLSRSPPVTRASALLIPNSYKAPKQLPSAMASSEEETCRDTWWGSETQRDSVHEKCEWLLCMMGGDHPHFPSAMNHPAPLWLVDTPQHGQFSNYNKLILNQDSSHNVILKTH